LFESDLRVAKLDGLRADLAAAHPDISFTTDYGNADVAVVFLNPFTGDYFQSTGLLDLEIHEATNVNLAKIKQIRAAVPQLVIGLNVILPWLLGNVEPLADGLVAGFDTRTEALFEVIVGNVAPSGRLPLTFPRDSDAIAVDESGICASPNDVPGYDKETYMEGRPYVYVDSDGNNYRLGHGLSYR
jgi:beta-glucosidase